MFDRTLYDSNTSTHNVLLMSLLALLVAEADAPPDEDETSTQADPAGT